MKRIKLYMSHAIRGAKGPAATDADMQANNEAAMRAARVIRAWLYPLPVDIYCPGEVDEFVMTAAKNGLGYLTNDQILAVDCEIIKRCDGLIWYSELGPSDGAEIEIACAEDNMVPVHTLSFLSKMDLYSLQVFVESLCQRDTKTN
ncbi:hypothetical protein [Neptuniibacter sp.]|uniref:hypothetical protein n=1 Tax=Neptuniibacter sp. TaxID=1962643 RepID=UPI0026037A62|nr:hypothetical protein [Neptuniibacter sp.]MCP4596234.1 hypothetical protein [Neptuniibacter sp.]